MNGKGLSPRAAPELAHSTKLSLSGQCQRPGNPLAQPLFPNDYLGTELENNLRHSIGNAACWSSLQDQLLTTLDS
ncbi:MAG: hypothetical protein BA870_03495 [Desulfuromonadales bacterium C00003094]|jgi:hypothetical protein|nr:MAG: hypothetical protein BA870_03495 [Desulfuromonadales bacterium C00003094]OEU72779.1 MAG: hypothetical protein BA869_08460 [Desulfuromonadales bacterium C00003107]